MANLIVGLIILAIVSGAATKLIIEKKKGAKCVGCPYGETDNESNQDKCGCS